MIPKTMISPTFDDVTIDTINFFTIFVEKFNMWGMKKDPIIILCYFTNFILGTSFLQNQCFFDVKLI